MAAEKKSLKPEVAAKYECAEGFLYGGKLVFPYSGEHGVKNKPAHELTLEEVDKLVAAQAVNGIFKAKTASTASAAAPQKT